LAHFVVAGLWKEKIELGYQWKQMSKDAKTLDFARGCIDANQLVTFMQPA